MKNLQPYIDKAICGNILEVLKNFPDASVDCVITSPPYWQQRDYGWKGQWGLEPTYCEYLAHLWQFMDVAYRILKPGGTVWVNLGDTYFGSGNDCGKDKNKPSQNIRAVKAGKIAPVISNTNKANGLKKKCQVLIPHRFAIGCIERGWILRNDIIWAKPNGLPESVTDRFSKRHEYIFFFVKEANYYFDLDAVRDPHTAATLDRAKYALTAYGGDPKNKKGSFGKGGKNGGVLKKISLNPLGKNPGDVSDFWDISTKHGSGKHYATFNTELITKPILTGCPPGGIILDPFCGSGTTGVRAIELGRYFIGIDGKKEYCNIANRNLARALSEQKEDLPALLKQLKKLTFTNAA